VWSIGPKWFELVRIGLCPSWPSQGYVLGPLSTLFTHQNVVLSLLPSVHAVLGQLYADDIQAYLHCLAFNAMAAVGAMTLARGALVAWMSSNRLRHNPSRTQHIWLGTRQQLAQLDLAAIAANFPHAIAFSVSARDLGVTLDQELPLLLTLTAYAATAILSAAPTAHHHSYMRLRTAVTSARNFVPGCM